MKIKWKNILLLLIIIIIICSYYFLVIKKNNNQNNNNNVNNQNENKPVMKDNHYSELSKLNQEKIKGKDINIDNYYKIKNFNVDNFDRYEKINNDDYQYKVTYVNNNLDYEPYTNTLPAKNPDSNLVLVNKYYYLDKNYVPSNLVTIKNLNNSTSTKVKKEAADAYEKLINDAKENNIHLLATTAYRSYGFQNTLYTNYVKQDGVKKADTYSARPGYSEHQTGLVIDLKDVNTKLFHFSDEYFDWLKNNCYKYGFIIRYLEENKDFTLYSEERWHIRYVGITEATFIMKNNISLEEYVDLYVNEY